MFRVRGEGETIGLPLTSRPPLPRIPGFRKCPRFFYVDSAIHPVGSLFSLYPLETPSDEGKKTARTRLLLDAQRALSLPDAASSTILTCELAKMSSRGNGQRRMRGSSRPFRRFKRSRFPISALPTPRISPCAAASVFMRVPSWMLLHYMELYVIA